MKKLLATAAISTMCVTSAFADATLKIYEGWNLVGLDDAVDISYSFSKNVDFIDAIWYYDASSKSWSAVSPNGNLSTTLQSAGITTLKDMDSNSGFWIKSNSSTTQNFTVEKEVTQ